MKAAYDIRRSMETAPKRGNKVNLPAPTVTYVGDPNLDMEESEDDYDYDTEGDDDLLLSEVRDQEKKRKDKD